MWRINDKILSSRVTLITNFMCDNSKNNKTFVELVEIFNRCKDKFTFKTDLSNDLRVLKYVEDMKGGKWNQPIYITSTNSEVTDGVHRGIAYLICIGQGVSKDSLPEIFINEPILD